MIRITTEMRAAFKANDNKELHRLLGLRPWELSPLDVDDGPCCYPPGTCGAESWPMAAALRQRLKGDDPLQLVKRRRKSDPFKSKHL